MDKDNTELEEFKNAIIHGTYKEDGWEFIRLDRRNIEMELLKSINEQDYIITPIEEPYKLISYRFKEKFSLVDKELFTYEITLNKPIEPLAHEAIAKGLNEFKKK